MRKRTFTICYALYPLSLLYWAVTAVRNKLFDLGVLRSCRFVVPVISVGNITVGGTGKTPHTEYIVRLLLPRFRTAVLSRGYKRKTKGFVLADETVTAEDIGDEPYQMAKKFPQLTVAVDADRRHGISRLLHDVDAIVMDDAFQHRYVAPGLSILLIDSHRPVWQDTLLPAGRLRESVAGMRRADIIIVSKCPDGMTLEEMDEIMEKVNPHEGQSVFFTTLRYGRLKPLSSQRAGTRSLDSLARDEEVLLVTGIASPDAIIGELKTRVGKVVSLAFGDHHDFTSHDVMKMRSELGKLAEGRRMIVTTEKDAARLAGRDDIDDEMTKDIYVLPVEVAFLGNGQKMFNQTIIEYVRENTRDSSFLERKDAHTA